MKKIAAMISVGAAAAVFALWYSQPKSYEDCVLKNLKGVESEMAARLVHAACREKFPEPPNPFDQFDNQPSK
ncbi:hypothetical protein [Desulfofustis limnaeus]|uniref:Entry exclusion lipoprotein TrbK n=1 Tax=Desulfofustis limnaeus TaxID=2740163 RepID=A0ABM7WAJ3_9BACT|nr:hypothetical protein [Desulfofustis limnaeus]BDD88014.1 hypothetical protein DPPLL_23790 [Desulfofustis limnaeus]